MCTRKGVLKVLGLAIACSLALGLTRCPAWAQATVNTSWIEGGDNWTSASAWSCHCIPNNSPAAVFNVTIPAGGLDLDDSSSLHSVTVNTLSLTGSLNVGGVESPASLSVLGAFTVVFTFPAINSVGIYGGYVPGAQSVLSVGAATPSTLTGFINMQGNVGGAALEYGNGGISQIGAGAANGPDTGLVNLFGPNAYLELRTAPGSNSALAGLKTIAASGVLNLYDGESVSTTGPLTNNGGLSLSIESTDLGSTMRIGGGVTNTGTIEVYGGGSSLSVSGDLSNSGLIDVVNGSIGTQTILDVSGNLTNLGRGTVSVGSAAENVGGVVKVGGNYTQTGGSTFVDGTLMAPTVKIAGGKLLGSGTVAGDVTNDSVVAPGNFDTIFPQTKLMINGNYTQDSGGTLEIYIEDPSDFSTLDVTGKASLDGTVDFDFGYVPGPNTDFAFLQAGGIAGDFTSLEFTNLYCPTCTFDLTTLSLDTGRIPPSRTPELDTLALLVTGLLGLTWLVRRRSWPVTKVS